MKHLRMLCPPRHNNFRTLAYWPAEKIFWQLDGVYHTSVGYAGGYTKNPTYDEVCSGLTGHTEVVRVVYDPKKLNLKTILIEFWEGHESRLNKREVFEKTDGGWRHSFVQP